MNPPDSFMRDGVCIPRSSSVRVLPTVVLACAAILGSIDELKALDASNCVKPPAVSVVSPTFADEDSVCSDIAFCGNPRALPDAPMILPPTPKIPDVAVIARVCARVAGPLLGSGSVPGGNVTPISAVPGLGLSSTATCEASIVSACDMRSAGGIVPPFCATVEGVPPPFVIM